MKNISKLMAMVAVLGSLGAHTAHAAVQGSLGGTSVGSVVISVTKNIQAQISDLTDLTLSNWGIGGGAVSLSSNVCVYSSTGSYKVTATGSGLLNAFTLASGLNSIPYNVTWNSGGVGALGNTGAALTTGTQSATLANAATASASCSGGGAANDTARVIVGIASTDMTSATSSATPYTGTLTLLITPY